VLVQQICDGRFGQQVGRGGSRPRLGGRVLLILIDIQKTQTLTQLVSVTLAAQLNSNRLRDFISQADAKGLALYVHECLDCCA